MVNLLAARVHITLDGRGWVYGRGWVWRCCAGANTTQLTHTTQPTHVSASSRPFVGAWFTTATTSGRVYTTPQDRTSWRLHRRVVAHAPPGRGACTAGSWRLRRRGDGDKPQAYNGAQQSRHRSAPPSLDNHQQTTISVPLPVALNAPPERRRHIHRIVAWLEADNCSESVLRLLLTAGLSFKALHRVLGSRSAHLCTSTSAEIAIRIVGVSPRRCV